MLLGGRDGVESCSYSYTFPVTVDCLLIVSKLFRSQTSAEDFHLTNVSFHHEETLDSDSFIIKR